MGAEIINNFDVKTNLPIDSKYVKEDVAARNNIPAAERYEGLPVYIRTTFETYQLQGGITNTHWVDITLKKVQPVDGIQFNLNPPALPAAEGLMQWNNVDGTLDLGMEGGLIVQQIGLEVFIQVYNDTASTITNGEPVYVSGRYNDILPTIAPSRDSDHEIAKATIGLVTNNIPANSAGYVTVHGKVRQINTIGLTEGQVVYVGNTAGTLSSSPPLASNHAIIIGVCIKEGLTDGVVLVKNIVVEEPRELNLTTGFNTDGTTTISYTNSSPDRTFTIEPAVPGVPAHYYQDSIQYYITDPMTFQWSNVEGIHYIAFNAGALVEIVNPSRTQVYNAIQIYPLICQLYWDATAQQVIFLGDERHGFAMDGATHAYLHLVNGPIWVSGMELNTIDVDESGADDEHAQFGINPGESLDEDYVHNSSEVLPTVGLPIYYRSGSGVLRKKSQSGYSVMTDITAGVGVSGRLVYNKFDIGVWSLEAVPTGKFVLCHIFSVDDIAYAYAAFVGSTVYDDIAAAQIGAESEITPIALEYKDREFLPIATVIFETADGYGNAVKARTRSAAAGDYVDWRSQQLNPIGGTSSSDHNSLSGKQPITNPPDEFYHLDAAQHAVATQPATALVDGYLDKDDWTDFDSKADGIHDLVDLVHHPVAGLTPGTIMRAIAADEYEFGTPAPGDVGAEPANANIQSHIGTIAGNPHGTAYTDLGPVGFDELSTDTKNPAHNAWIGASNTSASSVVTSDGATVTLTVQPAAGPGDLILLFSTGFVAVDCDPALEVSLVAGTDISPQINYAYILKSAPTVLTVSTTGWPAGEHHPIGTFMVQSAASVQQYGCYKVHLWTDHIWKNTTQNGHIAHINQWIRAQQARWLNGVALTYNLDEVGLKDILTFATAAGNVMQLHSHGFPAFDSAGVSNDNYDTFFVPNHPTPYTSGKDLATSAFLRSESNVAAADGNRIVWTIWGSVPEFNNDAKIFVNLPTNFYSTDAEAVADTYRFATTTIPDKYVGTGFLIGQLVFELVSSLAGNYQLRFIAVNNLLGSYPTGSRAGVAPTPDPNLESLKSLVYPGSAAFVKMTAANTFTLDTATYSLSTHNHTGVYAPISHTHGNITNAGAIGAVANLPIITTTAGVLTTGAFGTTLNTFCEGNDARLAIKATLDAINGIIKGNGAGVYSAVADNSTNWNTAFGWGNHAGLYTPLAHKTVEDAINGLVKVNGAGVYSAVTDNSATWNALVTFPGFSADGVATAGKAVEATDLRLSNARTPLSHTHGNITNAGLIGVTANLPIITGVGGILQAGSFGSGANTFCQGNDTRLSDPRTPLAHALIDAVGHTITGQVAGKILKATGATTYDFGYDTQHNASVQVQTGFNTDTYLINSSIAIPNNSLKAKSKYKLRFTVTKTAAGTAALVITVRFGTNGSTADTARLTFTAPTNQTAAVDTVTFDLTVVFRTVGAGSAAVIAGSLIAAKNTTNQNSGHWNGPGLALQAVSGGFDSTVSNSIIGVSYNGGTNYVGTCELVEATLENLI